MTLATYVYPVSLIRAAAIIGWLSLLGRQQGVKGIIGFGKLALGLKPTYGIGE